MGFRRSEVRILSPRHRKGRQSKGFWRPLLFLPVVAGDEVCARGSSDRKRRTSRWPLPHDPMPGPARIAAAATQLRGLLTWQEDLTDRTTAFRRHGTTR